MEFKQVVGPSVRLPASTVGGGRQFAGGHGANRCRCSLAGCDWGGNHDALNEAEMLSFRYWREHRTASRARNGPKPETYHRTVALADPRDCARVICPKRVRRLLIEGPVLSCPMESA